MSHEGFCYFDLLCFPNLTQTYVRSDFIDNGSRRSGDPVHGRRGRYR